MYASADLQSLSRVQLFATTWTAACQTPLSMGFSRQEYWSGMPFPSPGIFLTQGLNLCLLICSRFFTTEAAGKPLLLCMWSRSVCPTLCSPIDCSLPGSSVHGIFQARVLEWVAISFSRGSSQPRDWTSVSLTVVRCFTIWATCEVYTCH